ncbi:MAG: hypothetical protein ABEJ08_04585 [Halobacteriaceae archaeon]
MPSISRRSVLGAVGTVLLGSLAGCSALSDDRSPAGSLRFVNEDDLPHVISVRVTGVGSEPGEEPGTVTGDVVVPPSQRSLEASASIEPGEKHTYRSVFSEPVWYGIQFTLDGAVPENDTGATAFHPVPPDADSGRFLVGRVGAAGDLSWMISSTNHTGPFDR